MRNLEIVLKSRDIVRVGQERKLSVEELLLLNCGVGKHFLESLGQQGNQTSES